MGSSSDRRVVFKIFDTCLVGPCTAYGQLFYVALGHSLGGAIARNGLRLGDHVLEIAARLARRSSGMEQTASRIAAAPALARSNRLGPGLYGHRVHCGKKGAVTGPNPTDRGNASTKRHLLTDRNGLPLAFVLTGANVYGSVPLAELLDAVVPVEGRCGRRRQRPVKLHMDKAYDHQRCRRACRQRGIAPRY